MMEKKYQLVAWTENVTDKENGRLYMIPSLHLDMQEPYFKEIGRCWKEMELNSGYLNTEISRRLVKAYEHNARFLFRTGYQGDGLRFLCKAALHCIWSDELNWVYWDTDLGSYSHFCGELRHDFTRLCKEFMTLVRRYDRYDLLCEKEARQMMKLFYEDTKEERELSFHLKEMDAWKNVS